MTDFFFFYMILQLDSRGEGVITLWLIVVANLRGGKVRFTFCCLFIVACSRSFSLRFSLISLGKYNSMKFCKVWSKLWASAFPTACSCLQIGQLYNLFLCALIRQRTQNTWPHSNRIGLQAIAKYKQRIRKCKLF